MDEGVFIAVALVVILALIAGLYVAIHLHGERVLGLASEARGREQNEIVNQQRLARALNQLVDEMEVLTEALKTERILRSQVDGTEPTATAPGDREAAEVQLVPEAAALAADEGGVAPDEATLSLEGDDLAAPHSASPAPMQLPPSAVVTGGQS